MTRDPITEYVITPDTAFLRQPDGGQESRGCVVESFSDPHARLYYRFYFGTLVGNKYVCVVVKVAGDDAFVVTTPSVAVAYVVDRVVICLRPELNLVTRIYHRSPRRFATSLVGIPNFPLFSSRRVRRRRLFTGSRCHPVEYG